MSQNFVEEFAKIIIDVSFILNKPISKNDFEIIDRGIPHKPPTDLPEGKTAVYTFFCSKENCFLKIGKAGDRSKARFTSHHYNPGSANSNLAKSLLKDNELKNKYNFNEQNIKQWIKENCQRIDILFDISLGQFANELFESIFHYKYEPRYEG